MAVLRIEQDVSAVVLHFQAFCGGALIGAKTGPATDAAGCVRSGSSSLPLLASNDLLQSRDNNALCIDSLKQ